MAYGNDSAGGQHVDLQTAVTLGITVLESIPQATHCSTAEWDS